MKQHRKGKECFVRQSLRSESCGDSMVACTVSPECDVWSSCFRVSSLILVLPLAVWVSISNSFTAFLLLGCFYACCCQLWGTINPFPQLAAFQKRV